MGWMSRQSSIRGMSCGQGQVTCGFQQFPGFKVLFIWAAGLVLETFLPTTVHSGSRGTAICRVREGAITPVDFRVARNPSAIVQWDRLLTFSEGQERSAAASARGGTEHNSSRRPTPKTHAKPPASITAADRWPVKRTHWAVDGAAAARSKAWNCTR